METMQLHPRRLLNPDGHEEIEELIGVESAENRRLE
jgi:hypothetical protein